MVDVSLIYLMFNCDCEVPSVHQSSLIVHPMWEKVRKLKLDIPGSAFASNLFMMPLPQLLFFFHKYCFSSLRRSLGTIELRLLCK